MTRPNSEGMDEVSESRGRRGPKQKQGADSRPKPSPSCALNWKSPFTRHSEISRTMARIGIRLRRRKNPACLDKPKTAHVFELVQDEPVARRAGPEIVSAADFLATDFSEPEWLVDGMIPAGGTVLLSGMPKSGKTTLARQLALTASRGAPFLGRDTGVWGGARGEGSRVLYMALQGRKQGAWQAFKDMGMQPGDEIDFVFEGPPNGQRQWLRAAIEKAEASVVVIDMLFTLFGVKEISEYGEMNTVMNQIVDVSKSTGATIISLHHSPKNGGSSYLGSTAIRGSYDTGIFLKRDETGGSVQTDQREGEDMPSIRLKLDPVTKTFSNWDGVCMPNGGINWLTT